MLRTATITVLLLAFTVVARAAAGPVAKTPVAATANAGDPAVAQAEVMAAERAFAKTMADRDHAAFAGFLAEEAVFFSGEQATRGRAAVATSWARLYEGPDAPFSWEPDQVQVLESGTLALSTGPVRDPSGKVIARFNSIWRREAPGVWKVVFDKGSPVCAPTAP